MLSDGVREEKKKLETCISRSLSEFFAARFQHGTIKRIIFITLFSLSAWKSLSKRDYSNLKIQKKIVVCCCVCVSTRPALSHAGKTSVTNRESGTQTPRYCQQGCAQRNERGLLDLYVSHRFNRISQQIFLRGERKKSRSFPLEIYPKEEEEKKVSQLVCYSPRLISTPKAVYGLVGNYHK